MKRLAKWVGVGIVVFISWAAFAFESAVDPSDGPESGLSAPTSTLPPSVSTTGARQTAMERALIGALHERDIDRVWQGASDDLVLLFAYQVCDIADLASDVGSDPISGLTSAQALVGSLNFDGATPGDQLRGGAMLAALSIYPLCSPDATQAIDDSIEFIIEQNS